MLEDFFNNIEVPEFIREEFSKDDWYNLIARSKGILASYIQNSTIKSKVSDKVSINGNVYIGEKCKIGDYVVIDGPVYIGDNVEIGPNAYIRSGSIISNDCSVGHAAQVKNSIMMEGSKVSNHCFLGDSIIGSKARVGGHCETSNRRFDQGEIEFQYRIARFKTGLDKLGMILGEASRLGGGVFTLPGTMIGKNTFISTMACVGGFIEPNKFIKFRNQLETLDNSFDGELKHTYLYDQV